MGILDRDGRHEAEVRGGAEDEVGRERKRTRERCRMEEMSIRREKEGQGGVRKKSSDSGPKMGSRESVRKTEINMFRIQEKA